MQNPGRLLTRPTVEKIWDSQREVDTNLLDVYMSRCERSSRLARPSVLPAIRGRYSQ